MKRAQSFTRLITFAIVAGLLLCRASHTYAQNPSADRWIGTWATALAGSDAKHTFAKQTLRQIVHTSIGGSMVRAQISNLFGVQPLRIEDVHIAVRSAGASVVLSTDRKVKFSGQDGITIAPGSSAASDAISFKVPPLTDIAVSMYIPEPTGAATFHLSAHQTSYIVNGDASASRDLANAETTGSWFFLTNVDVQGKGLRGALVTLGASITEGYNGMDDTNRRWPDDLARRLASAGQQIGVLNTGIAGNRLLSVGGGPSAESRLDRDVLDEPGVKWVIFSDDPINDLGNRDSMPTSQALIAGYRRILAQAHAKGIRFLCSTLTPYEGSRGWTPEGEIARGEVNAFLRSQSSGCDAIVDQDGATHDPTHPTRFLPAYDAGDHLHPNDAGFEAIAGAVPLSDFSR